MLITHARLTPSISAGGQGVGPLGQAALTVFLASLSLSSRRQRSGGNGGIDNQWQLLMKSGMMRQDISKHYPTSSGHGDSDMETLQGTTERCHPIVTSRLATNSKLHCNNLTDILLE